MPDKKVPSFTLTADDEAFEKVVATYHACVQTRMELSDAEREQSDEELNDLLKAGRAYQRKHGVGKPKLDLKRKWQKQE